jgi:Kdo2-lipid IVA lauroyltransferase/acyltransferase
VLTPLIDCLSTWACKASPRQLQFFSERTAGLLFALYRLSPHRHFIQKNIAQALDLSDSEQTKLARAHIGNLLSAIITLLRFPLFSSGQNPAPFELQGYQYFLEAQQRGQGVILVSAHFGCWEMIPAVLGLEGYSVHTLVQRPSVPAFDRFFTQSRAFAQVQTVYNDTLLGIRPVLRALRQGEVVALVVDQHGESNTLLGQFFGHTVSMPEGPYFLSRRTGAAIVPVFTFRKGETHQICFYPSLLASTYNNAGELLQVIYNQIEVIIREHPEEWLWSYNRWDKYQPCPAC